MQSTEQKIERAALAGLAAASMDARERSTDISLAELAARVELSPIHNRRRRRAIESRYQWSPYN